MVSESTTATVTAPETPTKPKPAATPIWRNSSLDSAWTTRPCLLSMSKPFAASSPVNEPSSTPDTTLPAPPASTAAPFAMNACVSLLTPGP
ncbi:MAG: hypothetical protein MZV64_15825 [Ignavibacteriales bacterium]|nr:hypothetical protein [Ignavibacteriales bacterium]